MHRIFSFVLILFFAIRMYSCECPSIIKISPESIKQYDVIFRGRVDSVLSKGNKDNVWFTIQESFKGTLNKSTAVYYDNSTSCQMKMDKGDEWLIYAEYANFGKIEVNVCSRSRKYFAEEANDFYIANNGMPYADELLFLKTNIGVSPLAENDPTKAIQIQRELIHPSQTQMLYWLLASLVGFFVIYFLFKKFVK